MKLLRLEQAYPIAKLKPFPRNARQHDLEAIGRALDRGQHRTVVVREATGEVLAGNGVYAAALEKGWVSLAVSAVECSNEEDEINRPMGGEGDPDDVPAPPKEPITKPGDLWLLGDHRLLCGDSADSEALARLVSAYRVGCLLTDPPYGMGLDTDYSKIPGSSRGAPSMKGRNKTYRPVIGDDQAFDAAPIRAFFSSVEEQFWFGADYYRRTLSASDRAGSWLVWDKRNETMDVVVGSGFELLWSANPHKRDVLRHYWVGAFGDSEARNRVHPTQKPTKLLIEILERWASKGCVVADPFAGSGSTLLAAHRTGRTAYLMEIDPTYCDVICRRFQEQTGIQPILEATGEPHDFTAYETEGEESRGDVAGVSLASTVA